MSTCTEITRAPVLYSFRRCPYAMRARLALAVAGVTVQLREIVLRDKPQAMLDISPKGTVPVLQLADGTVIDESLEVMLWALGDDGFSELDRHYIEINDGPFKAALDRYKYFARQDESDDGKSAEDFRDEAVAYLHQLDRYLSGVERPLLVLALFPFVRQFRGVDEKWFDALPFVCLHTQLQQFLSSDVFLRVMDKYPPWAPSDDVKWVTF